MTSQSSHIVGTYSNPKDASYAVKALVVMAGLKQDQVSICPTDDETTQYHVKIAGSPSTIDQAKAFLGEPHKPQASADDNKSPYGLKHARNLMAFDDLG
ncbi:MAG: hypothetical protein ACFE0I_07315 [Elainellaceae cyanobacterium]